jgi:hypothetical protein
MEKNERNRVELEINQILTSIFDDTRDNCLVTATILDAVVKDIEETADKDFNDCDIKIAVGRVLKDRLGVIEF